MHLHEKGGLMAYLTLANGDVYAGESFGARGDSTGIVVFNTGMTGYLEALTDPSYYGQIVMMTYPLIGNIGVNWQDPESPRPQISGLIARELCETPSNWFSEGSLNAYLTRHGIVGIQGIDTRALTRRLRSLGETAGIITQLPATLQQLEACRAFKIYRPIVKVTCEEAFEVPGPGLHIGVLDFGVKASILSSLRKRGCRMTVYPALTDPEEILAAGHDGLLLTNGPGNPADHTQIIKNIRRLAGKLPTMGICIGHSILALACGAKTAPLPFGHRGTNHPVKDLRHDRVYITSQNHGHAVQEEGLPANMRVFMRSWNDRSIEGIQYTDFPAFTVQFHPEASPGPRDTGYLFDEFLRMAEASHAER